MGKTFDDLFAGVLGLVGAGGTLSGLYLISKDPKEMIGYFGTLGSLGALGYAIDYFKNIRSRKYPN